jgi:hypothetical protein
LLSLTNLVGFSAESGRAIPTTLIPYLSLPAGVQVVCLHIQFPVDERSGLSIIFADFSTLVTIMCTDTIYRVFTFKPLIVEVYSSLPLTVHPLEERTA